MVSRVTARNADPGQIRGKSFPPTSRTSQRLQGTIMFDSFITVSARLTLFSLFVLMIALAGAGA